LSEEDLADILWENSLRSIKVKLMKNERGLSKGYGYVDFESYEEMQKAIKALNGRDVDGSGRKLQV